MLQVISATVMARMPPGSKCFAECHCAQSGLWQQRSKTSRLLAFIFYFVLLCFV